MFKFDINQVTFEERVIMSYNGSELLKDASDEEKQNSTTTLYFTAPKEWTKCSEEGHCSSCIMIEFPASHPNPDYTKVSISPTIEDEDEFSDVDWGILDISDEEIQMLFDKAFSVIQES